METRASSTLKRQCNSRKTASMIVEAMYEAEVDDAIHDTILEEGYDPSDFDVICRTWREACDAHCPALRERIQKSIMKGGGAKERGDALRAFAADAFKSMQHHSSSKSLRDVIIDVDEAPIIAQTLAYSIEDIDIDACRAVVG